MVLESNELFSIDFQRSNSLSEDVFGQKRLCRRLQGDALHEHLDPISLREPRNQQRVARLELLGSESARAQRNYTKSYEIQMKLCSQMSFNRFERHRNGQKTHGK